MRMIGAIISFDHAFELFIALHRSPALLNFFTWFTYLGDARVLAVLAISMAIVLWRHRRHEYVIGLLFALAGSASFTYLLKAVVARGRPLPPISAIDAPGFSFPSMHAACAMAMYGFLAYMAWKLMHPPHHRAPLIAGISTLILFIGFSRLYLGVHYPSDVVAGFLIGGFFVWLGAELTMYLQRRSTRARRPSRR